MNTPERESGENVQDDAIHPETQQPCKDYFGKYGICPKGDSCPFTHGEDAIVVRSEDDIRRWQREEMRGGNSKWSGYELETLAKILRERLRHLLSKSVESGSTGEVETKVQKTERNEDVDADCSKESSIGRDSKRSASEVGLSQEDNSNTKLFRGTRPIVKAIQNSRIRWKTRQSTADVLFNKLVKKGLSEEEACERAMREEEDIYQSCGNEGEIVYTNTASHRFRKLFKTTFGDMR